MSGNHKFVLAMICIALLVVGSVMFVSGIAAIFFAAFICILFFILRQLVMPAGYGANKIRTLCIVGGLGFATSWGAWSGPINALLPSLWSLPALANAPDWIKNIKVIGQPSPWVLLFVFGIIFVVNFFMRDKTIGGGHPKALKDDFPEESFKDKFAAFCEVLAQDLMTIDRTSNWSPKYYTELQAEVEVLSGAGTPSRRKIVNLQEAIKKDRKTQAFLILGVPGSGKSVALRKLARDMLAEASKTNRVPIYINLREWVPASSNNGSRLQFDINDLEEFVIDNVKRRGDVFTEDFVNDHFRDLWRTGRLFFIFDSFDEISELLDADQDSEVINSLSGVISRFISSHPASRGVLSSRVFRRPTQAFLAQKTLEIRPLSEAGISEALSRYPQFNKQFRNALFRERLDLIPLARNPFIMALLGEWVTVRNELPENQAEIYENYISKRLATCNSRLSKAKITISEVMEVSTEIAWFVFSSPSFGIEAPTKVISEHFKSDKVDAVLDILRHARIARVTTGDEKSFAFVHRRFLEYFVTTRLLNNPAEAPVSDIPTDSRGRDALVLYAQLCDEHEARRLADICWTGIQNNFANQETRLQAIHCLRFLVDAFGSRREIIRPFEQKLSEFVTEHVSNGDSIILAKICLETTGLLPQSSAAPVLSVAITGADGWLQETAFRACRHLPKMEETLEEGIKKYVLNIPDVDYWSNRKNILLSLSLSDALRSVYRVARLRLLNIKIALVSFLFLSLISPKIVLASFIYAISVSAFFLYNNASFKRKEKDLPDELMAEEPPLRLEGIFADRGFWGGTISAFRPICFGMLIFVSAVSVFDLSGRVTADLFCSFYSCAQYKFWIAAINLVLGTVLLDWILAFKFIKFLARKSMNIKVWMYVLSFFAVAVVLGWGFYNLIGFLLKYRLTQLVMGCILVLFMAAITLTAAIKVFSSLRSCFKDKLMLKTLTLPANMARYDIARVFSECVSEYGRMQFVRKLEAARIIATGDWPADFKLAVGLGEPITALARLEERWLKLDR